VPLALALSVLLGSGGCAVYRFGSATMFPPDIQTIYVPIFESNSFRRNLGEWLTEAVCKEIEDRTPYKVVGTPAADSVLTGKITTDTKRVIIEDKFDYPRETQLNMSVEVRWVDNKGDMVGRPINVPVPQQLATLATDGMLVPEYGQSVSTAQMQAIQTMARDIVSLMEMPW